MINKFLDPETAKSEQLKWIKDDIPTDTTVKDRFDFGGLLIDPLLEIPSHKGLYHHGDQPDKPGYTIQELIHLSKSTFMSQRAMAFQTLARILKNIYSEVFGAHSIKFILNNV